MSGPQSDVAPARTLSAIDGLITGMSGAKRGAS